jgi:enamine deaminase RidA (YjgF/YER057c/UK114 family)
MSKKRVNFSSGVPWEPLRGYSRAVKVGDHLYISGTTALAAGGEVVGGSDAYEQTKFVLGIIRKILSKAEFQLSDVVRTRLYVTNIARWDEYARAHSEVFDKIRPASSIVQVSKLVDPRLLVEMEAEAIAGCELEKSINIE